MRMTDVNDDVYITMLAEEIEDVSDENTVESSDPGVCAVIAVITDNVDDETGDIEREEGQTDEEFQQMVCKKVGEAYARVKQSGRIDACFEKLDTIARRLGSNISLVFSTLAGDVMTDVNSLEKDITDDTSVEMYADTNIDTGMELHTTRCNWDMLFATFGGEEEVAGAFKDATGAEPSYNTEVATEIADGHIAEIDSVPVNHDTAEEIVDRVAYADESTRKDVEMLYRAITNPYSLKTLIRTMYTDNLRQHKYGKAIKSFQYAVDRYLPILYRFKKTTLNVPDQLLEQLHNNMDKVLLAFNLGAYSMMSLRKSLQRSHSILLDENVLNEDVADEATEEGEGVSEPELAAYLHVYHTEPNRPLPAMGINIRDVRLFGKRAIQECELNRTKKIADAAVNQHKTMANVAVKKLLAFTESLDDKYLPKGMTHTDYVKAIKNTTLNRFSRHVFTTEDHNLQSCLFDFVLDTKYQSPVLKMVHQRFGELAHDAISQSDGEALREDELNNIDNKVAIELSVDFIDKLLSR